MEDVFVSAKLQQFLKRQINHSPYRYKLRTLANCGVVGEVKNGVHVLSNGKETRIIGVKMCHHSWACPYCTATKLAKYSRRVGAAIDALSQQGLAAIMITFTFFHSAKYSCKTSYELLRRTYALMSKNAYWKRKKTGQPIKIQKNHVEGAEYRSAGEWANFLRHFQIKHTIKALEITYGKHGWHPHIHMLAFIPKNQLSEVLAWEDQLNNQWARFTDKVAKQVLSPKDYEIRKFLESKQTRDDAQHKSVYISKTDNGEVVQIHSGDYICGWGGNNELTGSNSLKVARKDNLTPLQMLEMAQELEHANPKKSKKLTRAYLQFAYTVIKYRIHRIDFSRTGLNAIVQNWINSEGYKETYKKKCAALKIPPYHTVCWLKSQTWREICYINDFLAVPIIPLIYRFATYENGYELISELFYVWNLPPPLRKHPQANFDWAEELNQRISGIAA